MNTDKNWLPLSSLNGYVLSDSLKDWLVYPSSFMKRLKKFDILDAEIQVTQQIWEVPGEDECAQLQLQKHALAFIREVLIKSPQRQWMYARTVIPPETLVEGGNVLSQLENRALGTILFKDDRWQRQSFEFACFSEKDAWFNKILKHMPLHVEFIWGRRSKFHLNEKKLLLTELFLPDIESLK